MSEQTEANRLADTPFALRDGRWNLDEMTNCDACMP